MDSRMWPLACILLTGSSLLQVVAGGYRADGGISQNASVAMGPAVDSAAGGKDTSYLFVQMANTATLRFKNPNNTSEGAALTLIGVPEQTIWFTSIPVHKAGRLSTSKLSSMEVFWKEAPNAALVGRVPGSNQTSSIILALEDSIYLPRTQRLSYNVRVLEVEGDNATVADAFANKPHTYHLMDGEMGTALMLFDANQTDILLEDATLFIDNFCYQGLFFGGCWDGHGNNVWNVGVGPWRIGGSSDNGGGGGCPNCGAPPPRGCYDQWGKWHWENEPYGYCDWNRNMWFYT